MQKPTEEDMSRDLAADLAGVETIRLIPYDQWLERSDAINEIRDSIAPAAIRRAAAAEAEVQRLRSLLSNKYGDDGNEHDDHCHCEQCDRRGKE